MAGRPRRLAHVRDNAASNDPAPQSFRDHREAHESSGLHDEQVAVRLPQNLAGRATAELIDA
jgi:hypothetical protein